MRLSVRSARPGDMEDIAAISRGTWEGRDYLELVAPEWMAAGGFLVGELGGRVVACAKVTMLPGAVAWLEGLRVHPDLRGEGYGRQISGAVLREALRLREEGRCSHIEFSTYAGNAESRALASEQGFRVVEWFHVLGREGPFGEPVPPPVQARLRREDLSVYDGHAPCGWKYPLAGAADSMAWLGRNARAWETSGGARLLSSRSRNRISPLSSGAEDPEGYVLGALVLAHSLGLGYVDMMIHDSHRTVIEAALAAGFTYWEEPGGANVPVYRHVPDGSLP